jgi:hypothetical protein
MADSVVRQRLTRDQIAIIAGEEKGQPQRIRALEGLVAAIDSDPIEAISSPVSGNTTYTISNVIGFQSILIRKANLVASAGGPFTLTITTGSGDVVYVPIAASGDTILSGDLLFDVYVDSSGNVISKDWEIYGSNSVALGYKLGSSGDASQFGTYVGKAMSNTTANYFGTTSGTTYFSQFFQTLGIPMVGSYFAVSNTEIGGSSRTTLHTSSNFQIQSFTGTIALNDSGYWGVWGRWRA